MLIATVHLFLQADENGNLRTQSGLYLLGWPVDTAGVVDSGSRDSTSSLVPVNVTVSQFLASPTRNLSLGMNLPAQSTLAGASGEAQLNLMMEITERQAAALHL